MKRVVAAIIAALFASYVFADGYSSTVPASYDVNRAGETAPTIDGVVSPGEWDAAAGAADKWVNLRADTPDNQNLRFQMLWDDEFLYILTQSDYDNFVPGREVEDVEFAPGNPDWNGTGYNPNIYLDPNTDNEALWPEDQTLPSHPSVDGYQIAWDLHEGHAERRPTEGEPEQSLRDPHDADGNSVNEYFGGTFLEAHANRAFGNNGAVGTPWDGAIGNAGPNANYRDDAIPEWIFAQNADNADVNGTGAPGAVIETRFAWTAFSATDPNKLVTADEAAARPEMVEDTREFLTIVIPEDHPDYDPDFPNDTIDIENPDFGVIAPNAGQVPGVPAFIGNEGDPDKRFADPESAVYIDSGLYAADGPAAGDTWAFEHTMITNDQATNFLPSWSEPLDGDPTRGGSFAPWGTVGHGQINFIGDDVVICTVPDGGILGDLDSNGEVAFADFLVLSTNFGALGTDYASGDIDCNGEVGFADFLIMSTNFGQTDAVGAESVPEPSSSILLLIGGIVALARRRRS